MVLAGHYHIRITLHVTPMKKSCFSYIVSCEVVSSRVDFLGARTLSRELRSSEFR